MLLAQEYKCHVLGVDVEPHCIDYARQSLGSYTGPRELVDTKQDSGGKSVRDLVKFECISVSELARRGEKFDVSMLQHVLMHFQRDSKAKLLKDIGILLKPNGKVIIHDIFKASTNKGDNEILLPLPFANKKGDFELCTLDQFKQFARNTFEVVYEQHTTMDSISWLEMQTKKIKNASSNDASVRSRLEAVGLALGNNPAGKRANMLENLNRGVFGVYELILQKKG